MTHSGVIPDDLNTCQSPLSFTATFRCTSSSLGRSGRGEGAVVSQTRPLRWACWTPSCTGTWPRPPGDWPSRSPRPSYPRPPASSQTPPAPTWYHRDNDPQNHLPVTLGISYHTDISPFSQVTLLQAVRNHGKADHFSFWWMNL